MSAELLLHECRRRGVTLWVEGSHLRYRGDTTTVDRLLIDQLRRHRSELIASLTESWATSGPQNEASGPIGTPGFASGPRAIAESDLTCDEMGHLGHSTSGVGGPIRGKTILSPTPQEKEYFPTREATGSGPSGPSGPIKEKDRVLPCEPVGHSKNSSGPSGPIGTQSGPQLRDPSFLTERWGPSLAHDLPPIIIPADWRSEVAALPHADWKAWRDAVTARLPQGATAEEIRNVERQVFDEMCTQYERTRI